MADLGVAMLSFAHVHADGYAHQVQENPRTRIEVVWDEDPARGQDRAKRYGVPFEADLERALSRPGVAGVVCDAPSSMHAEVLVAAAGAGKHLFTEKVLALTVAECDRIIEAARAAKVQLVVSMPQLCDRAMRWAKDAVDEGRLGDITFAQTRIGHSAAIDKWFEAGSWFGDAARAGGGALMDLGCHPVYRIRHLMGEPVSVMARMTNASGSYPIDDNGVILIEFAKGALGTVEASWVRGGGGPEGMALFGTKGWALIGQPGAPVRCGGAAFTGESGGTLEPGRLPRAWRSPMQQWVEAVLDGTPADLRAEWGRQLTEIMQAAYVSDRERREVRWPIG